VVGSIAGIQKFKLIYSLSDVFDPSVTNEVDNIPANWSANQTVTGLQNGATYFWYVRADYIHGGAIASPIYSFTIQEGSSLVV
jgi:hypothetical protein